MVESINKSVHWEDEEGGSDYQSSHHSAQRYLDEESVMKNFSQVGDGAGSSSNLEGPPIGLRLSKTSSFLNVVRKSVSKGKSNAKTNEKLKAGNFPAASIKIGKWEKCSRQEGDITAKLYYAKRKLVWEVMEEDVKYKIEIQWSDISAIRGIMRENSPGTLEVELSQPPMYFQEVNPEPRKHTHWKQASDFTGGQAPLWRRHIVCFKPGVLDKHYENLLQCNKRLFELSMKPFPSHESPYFDPALGISESINKPSFYQYPYQLFSSPRGEATLTLTPSMPAMNLAYTNMNSNHFMTHQPAFRDEGPSHKDQVYIENQMLTSHPGTSKPMDVINPRYDYSNAAHQYQYAPVIHDFFSNDTPPQQYSHDNGATNTYYQGRSSSLNPYYYANYI